MAKAYVKPKHQNKHQKGYTQDTLEVNRSKAGKIILIIIGIILCLFIISAVIQALLPILIIIFIIWLVIKLKK